MRTALHLPNFGAFADPRRLITVAQAAESAGWDGVFLWDHITRHYPVAVVDPWIALSAIAASTTRIKIGTLVTPLARRRPHKVAREALSLDWLSGGRLILGIGTGGFGGAQVEWANFGEEMDLKVRAAMTDEALTILTGLWSGEPFSFSGNYYQINETQFLPAPLQQPRIPLWIAGYYPNRPPMRRAARWDGMFLHYTGAEDEISALRDSVQIVREMREHDTPFDVIYCDTRKPMPTLAERQALAQQAAEAGATWWLEELTPQRFGSDWTGDWHFDAMLAHIQAGPPVSHVL
jgi:alkanesulfonate monooxygenase SsuD/methylene tetrahydromethanopterin reductase-like flavin-dependent oxidoreductase (luciferase family)